MSHAPNKSSHEHKKTVSIVVPIYNEAETCHHFFQKIIPILDKLNEKYEIICVNDGSHDGTLQILLEYNTQNSQIKIVDLSRNFGKEVALTAGIDFSTGDAVIPIDVDLQDPPELIPEMVERWHQGFDSVIAIRSDRQTDTYTKRTTAKLFYKLIGKMSDVPIPANAGDFRLLDRTVINALKLLPERNRFMKGLYSWVGFNDSFLYYSRQKRVSGASKLNYRRLWNLALEGILSFTTVPLRMWSYIGFLIALCSGVYGGYIIIRTLILGADVPGYPSLLVTILFLSGINMIGIGILGEYIGRIFIEVKGRPLYLVKSTSGFNTVRANQNKHA